MGPQLRKKIRLERRKIRVRKRTYGTSDKPRLTVSRTLKNIYCQLIDDDSGTTIIGLGTTSQVFKEAISGRQSGNIAAAKVVGQLMADAAKERGIEAIVFDRNGIRYHGRVKALADTLREHGLKF